MCCCVALPVPTQVCDSLKTIVSLQHLPMMLLTTCLSGFFLASLLHFFVCASHRYTSAPTRETNRTSVTILAVGRSLQQVAVEILSSL